MLFDHKKRFEPIKVTDHADYIAPQSQLSQKGVKMIDSWVPRAHGERLPINLALHKGFLIPIESNYTLYCSIVTLILLSTLCPLYLSLYVSVS